MELTQKQWKEHWLDWYEFKHKGNQWYRDNTINLYKTPDISSDILRTVKQGIKELVDEVGLNFKVVVRDKDQKIKQYVDTSVFDGILDAKELEKALQWYPLNKGGNFVITNKSFGNYNGEARFGNATLALNGITSERFIRNLTKHETAHLLGYNSHHNDVIVPGYDETACVMLPKGMFRPQEICDKCLDALKYFWNGVENYSKSKTF